MEEGCKEQLANSSVRAFVIFSNNYYGIRGDNGGGRRSGSLADVEEYTGDVYPYSPHKSVILTQP